MENKLDTVIQEWDSEDGSSKEEYIWSQLFNFCGCSSNSLTDLFFSIIKKLHLASKAETSWYYEYENKTEAEQDLQELCLHILDSKGLAEHGSSVGGSWLTKDGRKLVDFLFEESAKEEV